MTDRTCSVDDCGRAVHARGWCPLHYSRWQRYGDPTGGGPLRRYTPRRGRSVLERLLEKVEEVDGHWIWRGARLPNGYGVLEVDGKTAKAHRLSYELHIGPIPEGLHIDHLCRVRECVNPAHLEPVTCAENLRRSPIAHGSKTHCPQGHPYDEANTQSWKGRRHCRTCNIERARAWREARKQAS